MVSHPKRTLVIVLPDIRSTHNTGSFFRTADGAGAHKIYLTGITAPPPHPHLVKVSLGAENNVPWEYVADVHDVIGRLRHEQFQLVGVEQTPHSQLYTEATLSDRVAVFFGNEVTGLPLDVQEQMDLLIELPMRGQKESLNVSVVGGVVLYHLLHQR